MTRRVSMIAAALFAAVLATAPALAGPALDAAKASCQIGETIDGYLEVVPGASPSAQARAEMDDINNRRRAVYQATARDNNVDLSAVAMLTGERQVKKAADAKECFRDLDGWTVVRR